MKIAYLTNQYPKTSHTFIRREIEAIEAIDPSIEVTRFSVRPTSEPLSDPSDQLELQRTVVILDQGGVRLIGAAILTALVQPIAFWRSFVLAVKLGRKSDRGLLRHGIYLMEAAWLQRTLSRGGFDHLHAHFGTNSATVALLAHLLCKVPFSFTVHGPEEFDKVTLLGLESKLSHAAFVIAISNFGRSQLMRWCPSERWSKIRVVRCGVDTAYLDMVPAPVSDCQTFVCVGRLCEQKGQLLLIEAVGQLVREGTDVRLRLVGDGPMRMECQSAIERLQLGQHVTITGWASGQKVRDEILGARGLVLPSFAEGLPVVLMEAMALERTVISTYVAGIPELVRPGENGWLVHAGDVGMLASAMRDVLETPLERLHAMGRSGRLAVLAQHDVRKEAAKLERLFRAPDSRSTQEPIG